ncbi:Glycoside hydrolase family 5 protein [Mycena chlorophos]|uniref:Glycoside hydrolase family 5 protein n=1 Tax=Mycena chlorophos TaxID=658473 RepID=A0A8H6SUV3_MYCCL|nr:Glycoside hydrolase family 5 protein [Mycena chlorophos]
MALLSRCLAALALVVPLVAAQSLPRAPALLDKPFRCVNWAGHLEAQIPEGLSSQPLDTIVDYIASSGFNCVRLTYSIDTALGQTVSVEDSFTAGATSAGVDATQFAAVYASAAALNPFLATATRIDVFGAVVDALAAKGIMTVMDNHVSKASWCCDFTDGNGWWADAGDGIYDADNQQYFIDSDWISGLGAIATWSLNHPGVVAMSVRNEIRQLPVVDSVTPWFSHVENAGNTIHAAHPDLLVVIGGVDGAMDLSLIKDTPLNTGSWAAKRVWEFHAYSYSALYTLLGTDCTIVTPQWGLYAGFTLEQNESWTGPLWLSEFGVGMTGGTEDGGLDTTDASYLSCLVSYMTNNDADWSLWAVQGSYYVRQGAILSNETWGLLNFAWSETRNPEFLPLLGAMWDVTQGPGI